MLATAGSVGDVSGADWVHEMKWDGVRVIVDCTDDGVRLWSRNGLDLTETFADLGERIAVDSGTVLDGEVVAFDAKGRPDFGLLQQRLGVTAPNAVQRLSKSVPVHLMVFDILRLDGHPVIKLPYRERRDLLERTMTESQSVHVPPAFESDAETALAQSLSHGLEGIVAKRVDAPYVPGKRSTSWIKVKHELHEEVVVGGWSPGAGRRADTIGSLLVGTPDGAGALRYVGRVGTGFDESELRRARSLFASIAATSSPFTDVPATIGRSANWVTPDLVCEVAFSGWTSGGLLRHPVWRGWRVDKSPPSS